MDLLLENPRIFFKNNNQTNKPQGPFSINRDSAIEKPLFKHSEEWTQKQQIKFVVFFLRNYQRFNCAEKAQQWTMFKQVAKFIRTRNFTQCKSQYVKTMKKFGNIHFFYQHLKESFNNFQKHYECYQEELLVFQRVAAEALKVEKSGFGFDQFGNELPPTAIKYDSIENPIASSSVKICSMPQNIAKKFYPQSVIESYININQMKDFLSKYMIWKQKVTSLIEKK